MTSARHVRRVACDVWRVGKADTRWAKSGEVIETTLGEVHNQMRHTAHNSRFHLPVHTYIGANGLAVSPHTYVRATRHTHTHTHTHLSLHSRACKRRRMMGKRGEEERDRFGKEAKKTTSTYWNEIVLYRVLCGCRSGIRVAVLTNA